METTINGTYTLSVWIYPTSTTSEMILSKYNALTGKRQWYFYINGNKFTQVVYSTLGGTYREYITDNSFAANMWYHLVFVGNVPTDTYAIYVNGSETSGTKSGSLVAAIPNSDADVLLGAGDGGVNYLFNGYIDELAIWNRTLTKDEIENVYKRGMSLNLTVRECNDGACDGENFSDVTNDTASQTLSLTSNSYFQYQFEFSSLSANITPALYNVSIRYTDITPVPEWEKYATLLILGIVGMGYCIIHKKEGSD